MLLCMCGNSPRQNQVRVSLGVEETAIIGMDVDVVPWSAKTRDNPFAHLLELAPTIAWVAEVFCFANDNWL